MLKTLITTLSNNAIKSGYNISNNPTCVQCVRWRRKPRWLPVAKSKMFRVPERRPQDPDERAELMQLHNHYKTLVRHVRSYLIEETRLKQATSTADHVIVTPEQEEEDFQKCLDENAAWNADISAIRQQRLDTERENRQSYVLERLARKEQRDEETRLAADEMVRVEKERSKTFVLKENLDQAIEFALANPVDHNFAIELDGNILNGRITTDSTAKETPQSGQEQIAAN